MNIIKERNVQQLNTKQIHCKFVELPSTIVLHKEYPICIALPRDILFDINKELSCHLVYEHRCYLPEDGWCLIVILLAIVKGKSWPLLTDNQKHARSRMIWNDDSAVGDDKKKGSSGGAWACVGHAIFHPDENTLRTHITFNEMPSAVTGQRHTRLFLQVGLYRNQNNVFTSVHIPLYYFKRTYCTMKRAVVLAFIDDSIGQLRVYFSQTEPVWRKPYLIIDKRIICFDPNVVLTTDKHVSFVFNPSTSEIISKVKVLT